MNDTKSLDIVIFGATGGTGRVLLDHALDLGHHVTVLARTPTRVHREHARLRVVPGNVLDLGAVRRVVRDQDAVFCALGAPARARTDIREAGTRTIVEAMKLEGVQRLVCLSVLGIRDTTYALSAFLKYVIVPFYLKRAFEDHARQEEVVEASGLAWTLVRPPTLTDKPAADEYVHGEAFDSSTTKLDIPREDVAKFMLRQLTTETYVGKRPTIGAVKRARRARAIAAPSR